MPDSNVIEKWKVRRVNVTSLEYGFKKFKSALIRLCDK